MEPLHIKVDFSDAVRAKRELLFCEMHMLRLIKRVQNYKNMRKQELSSKIVLKAKIKKFVLSVKKLQGELPRTRLPEREVETEGKVFEKVRTFELEDELNDISERLRRLG